MYSIKLIILQTTLILAGSVQAYDKYKVIETDNGPIRGVRNTTLVNGAIYYSYRGIPYGKAPIKDLRFKAPVPAESWKPNILDAFDYGDKCPEPFVFFCYEYPMNEDCLSLNIFVPANVKPDEKLAVLFMIHGGSYRAGSGDNFFFGPDFIMEKNTILVTIQYRLGMLGFLSLNTTEYSGNMGLKDQQLALKWIHSNIQQFGGDNKRITIIGQSAGSACVNFHILSAESRKYFHNAIAMSGSSENLWALSIDDNHLDWAYRTIEKINETKHSFDELLSYLKEVPIDDLHWHTFASLDNDVFEIKFAPVIENRDAMQPFLVESPRKIYESLKIDVDAMFTMTSLEMLASIDEKDSSFFESVNANFSHYVQIPFRELNLSRDSDEHRKLANKIREFYFGNATITEDSIMTYLEMMSDINMFLSIDQSVKKLASISKGKIYFMLFDVDSKLNLMKRPGLLYQHMANKKFASHGDELCYLFRCGKADETYDEILRNTTDKESKIALQTIEYITKVFTNFAKYGDPAHLKDPIDGFLPVENDRTHFLRIDNDGLSTDINLRQNYVDFWNQIKREALELSNDLRQNEIDAE